MAELPVTFPEVAAGFEGPCLIEVTPGERSGRGRFWRTNRTAYTNDISLAGVYTAMDALQITRGSERSYAVDACAALEVEVERLCEMYEGAQALLAAVRVAGE